MGISNAQVDVVDNVMTCSYTRQNSYSNNMYFDTNKYYPYIVIAYGRGINHNLNSRIREI